MSDIHTPSPTNDGSGDAPVPPPTDVPADTGGSVTKRRGKSKTSAKKPPKAPRGRRGERRSVPTEGFDFRGGAFSAAVRTRVLNLVLIALVVLIAGTLLARAVTTGVAAGNDSAAAKEATEEADRLAEDLAERSATGAATQTDVDSHISSRSAQIAAATADEVDWPKIFSTATNLGGGIAVTSIAISTPSDEEPAPGETVPEEPTEETNPEDAEVTVTLQGTLSSRSQLSALEATLSDTQKFGWAEGGNVQSSCGTPTTDDQEAAPTTAPPAGGAACTWTWTGTLTDAAYSTRSTEIPAAITRPGAETEEGN